MILESDQLIILRELDIKKELPKRIDYGCCCLPLANFICPPLGTIFFTIFYFKYLKVVPAILLLIHLAITSLAIASFFYIDIGYVEGINYFIFGIVCLPMIGCFGGAFLVGFLF